MTDFAFERERAGSRFLRYTAAAITQGMLEIRRERYFLYIEITAAAYAVQPTAKVRLFSCVIITTIRKFPTNVY